MHPCLQLPEILHIVCKSLADPDLFHAALSCRRFTDPALDVLWHDLTSLKPLVHTLPDNIFETGKDGQRLNFSTNLNAALVDTNRLRVVYAPRIRSLRLSRVSRSDIQPEVLKFLEGLDTGALAPNLTHLDWYSECLATFNYITLFPFVRLFLSPGLKHIGIHLWVHEPAHRGLFAQISSQYSGVEVLKVTWDASSTISDAGDSLTESLCKFSNLKHLAIPSLPSNALTHASSLSTLHDLYLGDIGASSAAAPTLPLVKAPFAALTGLVMVSDAMEKLYGVIKRVSPASTPLRRLSISHTPSPFTDADDSTYHRGLISKWQAALGLVHDHCNPETLTWIDLKDSSYFDPDKIITKFPARPDSQDPLETIDISPLLDFKHLRMLELSFAHGLWLTKDILPRIAGAWKSITFMDLSTSYPPYHYPRINHEDVVYLVRDSPNLWGLGLNFDATQIPISPTLLLDKPIRRLLHLKVGNSPIESVGVVTGFLSMHFPRLYKVDAWMASDESEVGRDFSDEWVEVEKRLQQTILNRRLARKEKTEGMP